MTPTDKLEPRIRIIIADDHLLLRQGLQVLIETEPDMAVVGQADSGKSVVRLAIAQQPGVVVMDLSMAEGDGLAATRSITSRPGKTAKVLVLTMHAEEAYLEAVLEAGASGYLVKSAADRELVEAVRAVSRGEVWVQPAAARVLAQGARRREEQATDRARYERLTDRERAVMRLIAEGYTAPEIGEQLAISPKTVDTYKQRVNDKLGLTTRADYVKMALRLGLLGVA